MRGVVTAAALALLLLGGGPAETASAQEPATPVVIPPARRERFLGLDVFAGGSQFQNVLVPATGTEPAKFPPWGWDAGATVSVGVRWLGITGAFGRQTIETVPIYQLAVGPRVTSPWLPLGEMPIRGFAHALVGFAGTSGVTPSQSSAEWIIGGGCDVFLLRFQFDSVWLKLNGVKTRNLRVFLGGVVPLCVRGCRESDAFNVSGRPASK